MCHRAREVGVGRAVRCRGARLARAAGMPWPGLALRAVRARAPRAAHVLQSPGFARTLAASLAAQALVAAATAAVAPARAAAAAAAFAVQLAALDAAHSLALWSVVSMLASACCALQLALSALALGCSGANAWLGPLRPHSLAFAALLQAAQWWTATRSAATAWQLPALAATTCGVTIISLLPEALHAIGAYRRLARVARGGSEEVMELPAGKIGCIACACAAEEACRSVEGVVGVEVDVATGVATIAVRAGRSAAERDALGLRVRAALAQAGYEPAGGEGGGGGVKIVELGQHWRHARDSLAALVGGLLGSSCCAVQLAVNWLASLGVAAGGCTGLNTSLGPLRPHLRALTAAYFVTAWVFTLSSAKVDTRARLRLTTASALAMGLTFMPELLLWSGARAIAPPVDGNLVALTFEVDGMGCEACAAYVRTALGRASGVVDAAADHELGTATLLVQPNWGFDDAAMTEVAEALAQDGYAMASRSIDGSVALDFGDGLAAMLAPDAGGEPASG